MQLMHLMYVCDPHADQFHCVPLLAVNQALLKEDDDLLRTIFTQVFRHHHPQLANKVDVIFALAQVRNLTY